MKSKGYRLAYGHQIGILENYLFLVKSKGVNVLFAKKSVFWKRAYFLGKRQRG